MRRLFFFLCLWIMVVSCGKEERPADILTPDQMVENLIEIYITEAKLGRVPGANRDSTKQIFDYLDEKMFEKMGITDTLFQKSYNYYFDRPTELESIYTVVIDSLNLREQRAIKKDVK